MGEAAIPKIISVDDHVVEPAHVWQTWLPAKFRDRGPRVERRGIGEMEHIGGGAHPQTLDPGGPQADRWGFEGLGYIHKPHVAAGGLRPRGKNQSPRTEAEKAG